LAVQVARRVTRLWIRYLLKTKNATAHNASRRTITTAAITPPEGREELFAAPARPESAAWDGGEPEAIPPLTGTVVLPEAGLWRTVLDVTAVIVVGGDDDDDSMMPDEVESTGLGTGTERNNPPRVCCVAIEVDTPTMVVGVDTSFMPAAGELGTMGVGTGVPVVKKVVPSWSRSTSLL